MEEGDDEERSEPGERKVEVWTLKLEKKREKEKRGNDDVQNNHRH